MDVLTAEPFEMVFDRFGKFNQQEGTLYWIGSGKNPALESLQKKLITALKQNQIPVDEKTFRPHITLGRRMVMEDGFSEAAFGEKLVPIRQKVTSVSLMKSERIGGKLVYTEVYKRKFPVTIR